MKTPFNFVATRSRASQVFTPAVPIKSESLFAGRLDQVTRIVDAINQPGQHAVLFGERGVGKTSLANILSTKWHGAGYIIAPRIGCVSTDSFSDLWRKALREVTVTVQRPGVGFRAKDIPEKLRFDSNLPQTFGQSEIREIVTAIGSEAVLVLIFDEFDTLGTAPRKAIAETIKYFADYAVPVTLICVGVADSVAGLLKDHRSIERALIQVQMPRMSDDELLQIISNGIAALQMTIDEKASNRITGLSAGLPHYTHLLALNATRVALDRQSTKVNSADFEAAVNAALQSTQQSTIEAYTIATSSAHRNHLYREVLLACALADTDQLGFFSAAAVSKPLSAIMRKKYDIPSYARHLKELCGDKRGCILTRKGEERNFRFRFSNPLIQPYVILQGHATKTLPHTTGKFNGRRTR